MNNQNNYLIPLSILAAGAMIASAVVYLGSLGIDSDTKIANSSGLGLDTEEFMSCLESGRYQEKVARSTAEAQDNGGSGTPFFILNGQAINGAQPYSAFKQAIDNALENPEEANPEISTDLEGYPSLGDADAPLTLVEYSDFSCSFCKRYNDQTKQLIIENYVDKGLVYYVRKDFITVGVSLAAEAAYCAGEQDTYWEFAELLYRNQSTDSRTWANSTTYLKYVE